MEQYQNDFVDFMLEIGALKFGEFTLKSGRVSPYFFNAGQFNQGNHLSQLGQFYAQAIEASGINLMFYLAPPIKEFHSQLQQLLRSMTVSIEVFPIVLIEKKPRTMVKGGNIVGHPLEGDILIIDDVITAGTAIREAKDIIEANGANTKGVVVALDRQEKGESELSAIQEVEQNFGILVLSIINLSHIVDYLKASKNAKKL